MIGLLQGLPKLHTVITSKKYCNLLRQNKFFSHNKITLKIAKTDKFRGRPPVLAEQYLFRKLLEKKEKKQLFEKLLQHNCLPAIAIKKYLGIDEEKSSTRAEVAKLFDLQKSEITHILAALRMVLNPKETSQKINSRIITYHEMMQETLAIADNISSWSDSYLCRTMKEYDIPWIPKMLSWDDIKNFAFWYHNQKKLAQMDKNVQKAYTLKFGLDRLYCRTEKEIAEQLNTSVEEIKQILNTNDTMQHLERLKDATDKNFLSILMRADNNAYQAFIHGRINCDEYQRALFILGYQPDKPL